MPRKRLDWQYDDDKQQFTTPAGRVISLQEITRLFHERAECRFDFEGPWAGWRMRGAALIPPRGTIRGPHLKPHNLAAFLRWRAEPAPASVATARDPGVPRLHDGQTIVHFDREKVPANTAGPTLLKRTERFDNVVTIVVVRQSDMSELRVFEKTGADLGTATTGRRR